MVIPASSACGTQECAASSNSASTSPLSSALKVGVCGHGTEPFFKTSPPQALISSREKPAAAATDFDDAGDFDEDDDDEEFDELSIEELFLNVTAMWSVLGAIDEDDRLTPLGWWGLPEAMSRAWTEPESE
ncbi:MAG: hypothetical protein ABSD03_18185 [Vulcanimicrobiaceae bacterium]